MTEQPELFWGLIVSHVDRQRLILLVLNLPLIGLWVKMISVPYHLLFPADPRLLRDRRVQHQQLGLRRPADGVLRRSSATSLRKLDCEPAPMLLGFILGPMMEENLRRALMISKGDPTVFVTRPVSAVLLVLSALLLITVMAPAVRKKREEAFAEEE